MKGKEMIQRTFCIIKPDATARHLEDEINGMIEKNGFKIVASKRVNATRDQFETFYAEHKGKPFFEGLVEFMTSGPIVVQVLEKENAIQAWRDLMGKTDPAEAAEGTIRKKYAESKGHNSVHGSDSPASAEREINLWFTPEE